MPPSKNTISPTAPASASPSLSPAAPITATAASTRRLGISTTAPPYTQETEEELLEALAPDYIRGLSLLGGEPMEPAHQAALLPLLPQLPSALSGENRLVLQRLRL